MSNPERTSTSSTHTIAPKALTSGDQSHDQPPGDWTAPERAMWLAYCAGGELDLSDPDPTQNDPAKGAGWGSERTLRAAIVSQILLHPPKVQPGHPDRFKLIGARISGELDLGCANPVAFLFRHCRFDETINLSDASAAFVGFIHCNFPSLIADRLKCEGPVWLDNCVTTGLIEFEDSVIQGEVSLNEVKLSGSKTAHRACFCGASIHGDLMLRDAYIEGSVGLTSTNIYGSIALNDAKIYSDGSTVYARLANVTGDVEAPEAFESHGVFVMEGAHIGGQLIIKGARLLNHEKRVLDLDHAQIDLGVIGGDLFADGEVAIHHARIGCQVGLSRAHLSNKSGLALRGDHLIVDGSLFINGDAHVDGQINLHGAEIKCTLNIRSAELVHNEGPALEADGMFVGRNILGSKCRVTGGLLLSDSKIGGSVGFRDAYFEESGKYAIEANRVQIGGSLVMTGKFTANNVVSIQDASIGTTFEFFDAQFKSTNRPCLVASGLRIQGDIVGDRVKVDGLLDLAAITASGDVRIADAEITGIRAQEYSLGSPVDQRRGGIWRGVSLRMTGSIIAGDIDFRGTSFKQSLVINEVRGSRSILLTGTRLDSTEGPALLAVGLRADVLAMQFKARPQMSIDLSAARVTSLADTKLSWPESSQVNVMGFGYDRLDSDLDPKQRLDWLANAVRKYSPQPYEQLASYYLANGDADHARDVRLASIRRSYEGRSVFTRLWGAIQDWSLGFGYRPLRAAVIFICLWIGASLYFSLATGPCTRFGVDWPNLCPTAASGHLAWNPWLFSFDLLLPVVNLGYKTAWDSTGEAEVVSLILTVSGWILTTTIVAAAARRLKRS